ncbi:MAG: 1-acyl-sn-glycerol-3-phosphate acyltransferase [Prevotella sp.]
MNNNFEDIRPYVDNEIPQAMQRIAESPMLSLVASYIYPSSSVEDVRSQLKSFHTIRDFQHSIMYDANRQIIANTIDQFTFCGGEQVEKGQAYLFVSNHRDIMLDASLLQKALIDEGHETTQISFGANLMMNPLVVDIGKSNKMFKVERPGASVKDFYKSSMHLSDYIRHVITENKESAWIAQRNGRTKDGNDKTDQGIIKMFCMSKYDNKIDALDELHIIPVAVSYEWEPCDILKAIELYESRKVKYIKKPGEDLNSILTGILQPKGRVHFQLCPGIMRKELMAFEDSTSNDYHKQIAQLIDSRIFKAYKLWPNNYIAYDILHDQLGFSNKYTSQEKERFENHLHKLDPYEDCSGTLTEIFLGIYANPVKKLQKIRPA